MPWLVLIISAVFEAIWATALGYSENFTRLVPTLVFLVTVTISMLGLGWAAKHIPIGTAYAVWTGIGAALTVGIAVVTGQEALTPWKAVFLGGIIAAVVGLKLVPSAPPQEDDG
jgi:quaternary ammonium compound-resistance protein SugE